MLALQSAATLSAFGATAVTGQFVSLTMIRELGPVLTGIMVSGRNASSMASELGSMVVTEQIDAMRALGVDPIRKLVTPRIFATVAMLFFLTIVSDAFGIAGGGLVTVFLNHQNGTQYLNMAWEHLRLPDIVQGLMKPIFFGYILSSIGCFYGLRTTGGTQGVGRSTIQAVVTCVGPHHLCRLLHHPAPAQRLCLMDVSSSRFILYRGPGAQGCSPKPCSRSPDVYSLL